MHGGFVPAPLAARATSLLYFFFSSRRRHTRSDRDWSSDVCSSDLVARAALAPHHEPPDGLSGAHDPPRAMTDRLQAPAFPAEVERQLQGASPCEIAVGVLTYNNATTVPTVVEVVRTGLERHFAGIPAVLINADAGSSDATPDLLAAARLPLVRARHETPLAPRIALPLHRVPRRGAALRLTLAVGPRLRAR